MNRHTKRNSFALLVGCTLLAGCDTRREILDDPGVWVRVEVDWRPAGILPEGTSIHLFKQETGGRTAVLRTNDMCDSVACDSFKLHAGRYSLLVFNETERSHDDIAFRGTERYHTTEAHVNPLPLPEGSRYIGPPAVHTVTGADDVLAADHLDLFEVNGDMIRSQRSPTVRFTPQRLTVTVDVIIHVQNIRSLHTGKGQTGALDNMAEGALLAAAAPNTTPAVHWFALTLGAYDAATNSGTLRATFGTFGALPAAGNRLLLYLQLRDDTDFEDIRDVTGQVHAGTTGRNHLTVEIGTGPANPHIILPDLPGDDGAFEVDVGGWGDDTEVNIPI
jgi:hypothetical protein